jgi:hypothetical protein
MVVKNFCVVFFTPIDGCTDEILDISISTPRIMKGKGISMLTFSSAIDIESITDYLTENNRNFLLFDLDKLSSGVNFTDKQKENEFFGFINDNNDYSEFERYTNDLLDDLVKSNFIDNTTKDTEPSWLYDDGKNMVSSGWTSNLMNNNINQNKHINIDVGALSKKERNDLVNSIIDKGLDNLTDLDKDILEKISNFKN